MSAATPSLFFVLLVLLLFATIGGSIWLNYTHNRRWYQEATKRGWFYTQALWRRRKYHLAGTTANGVVWELSRIERDEHFYYRWLTHSRPLPFGSLTILPRAKVTVSGQPSRSIAVGSAAWQARFAVFASHDQLAVRTVVPEVELELTDWPLWPELGSLERVVWNQHRLEIYGRFQRDWITLDRLVALGEALVASVD